MPPFSDLLQQGTAHAWLFVPSAILLGALHGLEPGHSKTMMAAFIIAVRGTVTQAVLLGLAAAVSHTTVVWAVALGGQYLGQEWGGEAAEPYFQLASAAIIVGIALWMAWRTWRGQQREHDHHRHGEVRHVTTRTGLLTLEVFEDGVVPRWRVRAERGELPEPGDLTVETVRPDGGRQTFAFANGGDFLESLEEIPEPHAFTARLRLEGPNGGEIQEVAFEEHDHGRHHAHMNLGDEDDAHARARTPRTSAAASRVARRPQARSCCSG